MHKEVNMLRRGFVTTVMASPFAGPLSVFAQSDEFPRKPMTIIVGTSAGSLSDQYMRGLAEIASKYFNNEPFIIENKPGAGATMGVRAFARMGKGDGYTIAQTYVPWVRIPIIEQVDFDPFRDVTWIVGAYATTFGVVVATGSRFKTLKDVLDAAKSAPDTISFGTVGTISAGRMIVEMLTQANGGGKLIHVPFKGAADASAALLGNHVDMLVDTIFLTPQIRAGKARMLATFGDERLSGFPDVPTARELGHPVTLLSEVGIAGPKNMDPNIVQRLHDGFKKAMDEPAHKALLEKYELIGWYKNSADFTAAMKAISAREKSLADQLGWTKK